MKRNNLDEKHNALDMILRRMSGDVPILVCPVGARPQPKRQSALTGLLPEILEMRRAGKTLEEIAVKVGATVGRRTNRSTVLRILRKSEGG